MSHLANVISIMNTLSYAAGPLAVAGLRYIAPDWHSPCRIPGMKLSVSLADEDVEFLDEYARAQGIASRSAVVQRALRLLRAFELAPSYALGCGMF